MQPGRQVSVEQDSHRPAGRYRDKQEPQALIEQAVGCSGVGMVDEQHHGPPSQGKYAAAAGWKPWENRKQKAFSVRPIMLACRRLAEAPSH